MLAFLATVLLARQQVTVAGPPMLTVGFLYEGCVLTAARSRRAGQAQDRRAMLFCDVVTMATLSAATDASGSSRASPAAGVERACLPDSIVAAHDEVALAEAFIAYVDAHPAVRSGDPGEIFDRAMAGTWPCPL